MRQGRRRRFVRRRRGYFIVRQGGSVPFRPLQYCASVAHFIYSRRFRSRFARIVLGSSSRLARWQESRVAATGGAGGGWTAGVSGSRSTIRRRGVATSESPQPRRTGIRLAGTQRLRARVARLASGSSFVVDSGLPSPSGKARVAAATSHLRYRWSLVRVQKMAREFENHCVNNFTACGDLL